MAFTYQFSQTGRPFSFPKVALAHGLMHGRLLLVFNFG
jgi:hypothetical protein